MIFQEAGDRARTDGHLLKPVRPYKITLTVSQEELVAAIC